MPSKRASRGRRKGGKGSSGTIQCVNCAGTVPKDKAKKVTSRLSLVEHQLAKELRAQGAYICLLYKYDADDHTSCLLHGRCCTNKI